MGRGKKNTFDNYPKFESLLGQFSKHTSRALFFLKFWAFEIQLTLDNSNLSGKSKKVRVIGSSKQITGNKEMDGEGVLSCTLHFEVAQPSIFVGTLSIFESLILKQIDLYCENIITHVLLIN